MRRSLILAAALALAGATHANAADHISHDVQMLAAVPSACSFSAPEGTALLTNVGAASSTFQVEIDPAQARVVGDKDATLTFSTAFCNSTSTVSLERDGFRHVDHLSQNGLPAGVTNQIEYDAVLMWGGSSPIVAITEGVDADDNPNVAPRSAPLSLAIFVPGSLATLVAGNYTDTLRLSVNPN